jgi:hypothetical protein
MESHAFRALRGTLIKIILVLPEYDLHQSVQNFNNFNFKQVLVPEDRIPSPVLKLLVCIEGLVGERDTPHTLSCEQLDRRKNRVRLCRRRGNKHSQRT